MGMFSYDLKLTLRLFSCMYENHKILQALSMKYVNVSIADTHNLTLGLVRCLLMRKSICNFSASKVSVA